MPLSRSVAASLILGALLGGIGTWLSLRNHLHECETSVRYTNPDAACIDIVIDKRSYETFRDELVAYLEAEKQAGHLTEGAIFFRDLKMGPTFDINELANFSPASLLKLPLALAYLKYAEEHPGFIDAQIRFTKNPGVMDQTFEPSKSLQINTVYSISEALRYLVTYSDNVAYGVLGDYIVKQPQGNDYVFQSYKELGIIDPTDASDEIVSVHGYASIFRLLYNVSFLESEYSELMLSWLVDADFNQGLRKGVPVSVPIAHKFGERVFENSPEKQLHDCGIVYYPGNPYVVCVMTRGDDWNYLSSIIGEVSRRIYEEVDSRRF